MYLATVAVTTRSVQFPVSDTRPIQLETKAKCTQGNKIQTKLNSTSTANIRKAHSTSKASPFHQRILVLSEVNLVPLM